MKKNTKKIIAATAVFSMLSTGAVFAAEPVLISEPVETISQQAPVVNGAKVYGVEVKDINGIKMIPLRHVAEGLGYEVIWNEEGQSIYLSKGAQNITMAIGEDEYAFSRRAPQALGAAPTLVDGSVTYVPITLISDIIGGYYSVEEDGTYKIVNPSIVTVTDINEDGSLVVSDGYMGEVIVRIDENTKITSAGVEAKAEDIKKEMVLAVEYADVMTASIPPQTTAITINIENLPIEVEENAGEVTEVPTFSGKITEIDGERVMVGTPFEDDDAVCLIITEDTKITKGNDKRIYKLDDLEVGMEVSGTLSDIATMSIPPQSVALTVEITPVEEEVQDEVKAVAFEGEITAVDGQYVTIGEGNDAVVLVVSDDTQITKGNDKRIYKADDLEVGMKISGTHSMVSTRSLPPQTAAFTIAIEG